MSLRKACSSNDPQNARRAVLHWASEQLGLHNADGLEAVARRCGGEIAREIQELDRSLFAGSDTAWRGDKLFAAVRGFKADKQNEAHGFSLYPTS